MYNSDDLEVRAFAALLPSSDVLHFHMKDADQESRVVLEIYTGTYPEISVFFQQLREEKEMFEYDSPINDLQIETVYRTFSFRNIELNLGPGSTEVAPDMISFKYISNSRPNTWEHDKDTTEFAKCYTHYLNRNFKLNYPAKSIQKGDILMRPAQRVDKNDLTLFFVAMKSMANPLGFNVVGRIDPLIHQLDVLHLPLIRRQQKLEWYFDLNGEMFQNSDEFQIKRECATIVQEFMRDRVHDWKIKLDTVQNQLIEQMQRKEHYKSIIKQQKQDIDKMKVNATQGYKNQQTSEEYPQSKSEQDTINQLQTQIANLQREKTDQRRRYEVQIQEMDKEQQQELMQQQTLMESVRKEVIILQSNNPAIQMELSNLQGLLGISPDEKPFLTQEIEQNQSAGLPQLAKREPAKIVDCDTTVDYYCVEDSDHEDERQNVYAQEKNEHVVNFADQLFNSVTQSQTQVQEGAAAPTMNNMSGMLHPRTFHETNDQTVEVKKFKPVINQDKEVLSDVLSQYQGVERESPLKQQVVCASKQQAIIKEDSEDDGDPTDVFDNILKDVMAETEQQKAQ